ncbi:hypothetical protein KCV07_g1504, partial [Aureobasidium melanogenum]
MKDTGFPLPQTITTAQGLHVPKSSKAFTPQPLVTSRTQQTTASNTASMQLFATTLQSRQAARSKRPAWLQHDTAPQHVTVTTGPPVHQPAATSQDWHATANNAPSFLQPHISHQVHETTAAPRSHIVLPSIPDHVQETAVRTASSFSWPPTFGQVQETSLESGFYTSSDSFDALDLIDTHIYAGSHPGQASPRFNGVFTEPEVSSGPSPWIEDAIGASGPGAAAEPSTDPYTTQLRSISMDEESFIDPSLLTLQDTRNIPKVGNKELPRTYTDSNKPSSKGIKAPLNFRIFNSRDQVTSSYKRPKHNLGKTSRVRSVINPDKMPTAVFRCPLPDCIDFTIGTELATVYKHMDDSEYSAAFASQDDILQVPIIASIVRSTNTIFGCTTCQSVLPSMPMDSAVIAGATALTALQQICR